MSKKILLIRPENIYHYNNYPPLNLISIGSALKEHGFCVKIINCFIEKDPLKTIYDELNDCLFVGITLLTPEVPDALKILKFVKEKSKVPIVVGGWHCTLFPEQMADSEYVDYVIAGDGEEHILALSIDLKEGKMPGNRIFSARPFDINQLPVPYYSLDENIEGFITSSLQDQFVRYIPTPVRWLPYQSSRGCPSQCSFCINVVTGNTLYRKKFAEKVIQEIKEIINTYHITHLKIIDDNFFVDKMRVMKICEGILANKMKFTWDAECRCDYFNDKNIDDDLLSLAKKAGLVQLTLGIESGSQHTLEIMKKHITLEQAEYAVMKCNEIGIVARSSFMIEVPGESFEDIKKTVRFINKLRKYPYFVCGVTSFRPYPNASSSEGLTSNGFLVEPKTLEEWTNKEIIDLYTAAEYIRPWQIKGKYSEQACHYLNMESGARLGVHQIHSWFDIIIYCFFFLFAKLRNKFLFYYLPLDMHCYKKFLFHFYKRKQVQERNKAYKSKNND